MVYQRFFFFIKPDSSSIGPRIIFNESIGFKPVHIQNVINGLRGSLENPHNGV